MSAPTPIPPPHSATIALPTSIPSPSDSVTTLSPPASNPAPSDPIPHQVHRKSSVTFTAPHVVQKSPSTPSTTTVPPYLRNFPRSPFTIPTRSGKDKDQDQDTARPDRPKTLKHRLSVGPISLSSPFLSLRRRQSQPPPTSPSGNTISLNSPTQPAFPSIHATPSFAPCTGPGEGTRDLSAAASPAATAIQPGLPVSGTSTPATTDTADSAEGENDSTELPNSPTTATGSTFTSTSGPDLASPRTHRPLLHISPFSSPHLVHQVVPEHEPLTSLPSPFDSPTAPLKTLSYPSSPASATTRRSQPVWLCSRPSQSPLTPLESPSPLGGRDENVDPMRSSHLSHHSPHLSRTSSTISVTSLSERRKLRPLVVRANSTGPGAKVDENGAIMYMSLHSHRVVATSANASQLPEAQGVSDVSGLGITDFGPAVVEPPISDEMCATAIGSPPALRRAATVSGAVRSTNGERERMRLVETRERVLVPVATSWRGASGPNGWNWRWVLL